VASSRRVGGQNCLAAFSSEATKILERAVDRRSNVSEPNAAVEEQRHRGFVRSIEDRRRCTAGTTGRHSERKCGKLIGSDWLERERRTRDRIERRQTGVGNTIGMSQRIQHRKLHTRHTNLRKDAAVDELDE
jgi:hypothetical protein